MHTHSLPDAQAMTKALVLALALAVAAGACKKSPSTGQGGAGGQGGAEDSGSTGGNTTTSSSSRSPDAAVKTGFSRCIEDWPTSGGPHPIKPSLEVEAPKLLWKAAVDGYTPGDVPEAGPVLSKDRLVFQAGKWVYFLNKDGTKPQWRYVEGCPSGLVADEQGNVYYTSDDAVVSLDAKGESRWHVPVTLAPGQTPSGPGEGCRRGAPPVLAPDGVLYSATYDYMIRAIRASDGKVLWSQPTGRSSRVMGGGGKAVFVAYGQLHTDALDTRDGSTLGSFIDPYDGKSFVWGWGTWLEGWEFGVSDGRLLSFDPCGRSRWDTRLPLGSGVVTVGERLVTLKEGSLILYGADGNALSDPAPSPGEEGWPIAAGADGTIYWYRSQRGTMPTVNRLLAYSPDLKELWRIELTAESSFGFNGNVVLDDDGVLYLSRPLKGSITEILAIQTRSPGLADSSWPSFRHDNRGTAWLVPGTPANSTPSDAATSDAIDAPVELGTRD